jgi:hypothetical protein
METAKVGEGCLQKAKAEGFAKPRRNGHTCVCADGSQICTTGASFGQVVATLVQEATSSS